MFYNKTMRTKWLVPIVFLIFTPILALVPENRPLSSAIAANLTENGFTVTQESLTVTAQDKYPFNLSVDFLADRETEKEPDILAENKRDLMIFAFTQADAAEHSDKIIAFLKDLENNALACNVTVVFTTQEHSPLNDFITLTGTEVFARNFDDADRAAAIVITFDEKKTAVYTGNPQKMTPLWLARQITSALSEEHIAYDYPDMFASLHRLGFIVNNRRMSAFIRNNIPAVTVQFSHPEELAALQRFCVNFSDKRTSSWDNHYIFLHLPKKPLIIGEPFFFLVCMILGTLLLLILCTSTFVGKRGADYKKEFLRSWYFIPLTIAVTFAALWVGQKICALVPPLAKTTPIIQFGVKLTCILIFSATLFTLQEYLRLFTIQLTHGYFIYLVGIANIFIFSAVDLLFFVILFLEYICIYIARKAIRFVPLAISTALMLLPFVPYVYLLARYGSYFSLQRLVFATPLYNLLLSLLIFPFLIMWLKMIVRMEIYVASGNFLFKKTILNSILFTGIIIGITFIVIMLLSAVYKKNTSVRTLNNAIVISDYKHTFTINASKEEFLGISTRHIAIDSKEPAVRYNISISSDSSIPLYDSNYDYTVNEETTTATFTIPHYPPQEILITYSTDTKETARILVDAWYETEHEHVFRKESRAYLVIGDT